MRAEIDVSVGDIIFYRLEPKSLPVNPERIWIGNMPDLIRISEEVEATKTPRELKRDRKTVAILMPAITKATPERKQAKTKADYEAFLLAAGGWGDMDTYKLIANIYATRRQSNRSSVKL